jgi:PTS system mannose-specific IIA component
MVGLVLFGHNGLGRKFLEVARSILGELPAVEVVDIESGVCCDDIERRLNEAIKEVDGGSGVVVLVDLFGGSPANFSLARLVPGKVEVVSGMNLAMLLKFADLRSHGLIDPAAMARAVAREGRENILVAGDLLARENQPRPGLQQNGR